MTRALSPDDVAEALQVGRRAAWAVMRRLGAREVCGSLRLDEEVLARWLRGEIDERPANAGSTSGARPGCRSDPVTGKRVSTECRDLEAAIAWRAHREFLRSSPAHAAAKNELLSDWIESFLKEIKTTTSAATLEVAQQKTGHFLRLWPGARLSDVAPPAMDRYVEARRKEGSGDLTISREVAHLVRVMRRAARAGRWGGDPNLLRPLDLRGVYTPRTRALTPSEVVALLRALEPRRAAVVAIAVATGACLSELWKVRVLPDGSIAIPGTKRAARDRIVPALSVFEPLLAIARSHLPLKPWGKIGRDLDRACRKAGIERCTPNDLRRTHATLLREIGVDRDVVRRLMGHTTTALVDRVYGQPRVEALAAQAESAIVRESGVSVQIRHTLDSAVFVAAERAGKKHARATSGTRNPDLRFTNPADCTQKQRASERKRALAELSIPRTPAWERTEASQAADGWDLAGIYAAALARRAA